MTLDVRLAEIVSRLEAVGVRCLVMCGHAVRYYGFHRDTNDFDLCLAPEAWDDLAARIARSNLGGGKPLAEGPSWRIGAFRRFELERFPDGREQWLEFWRTNHLLDDFSRLHERREHWIYGGRSVPFLALADLIRSKETEREKTGGTSNTWKRLRISGIWRRCARINCRRNPPSPVFVAAEDSSPFISQTYCKTR